VLTADGRDARYGRVGEVMAGRGWARGLGASSWRGWAEMGIFGMGLGLRGCTLGSLWGGGEGDDHLFDAICRCFVNQDFSVIVAKCLVALV